VGISRLPLGNPKTKSHLDVALLESYKVYYSGEGGGFPQVRAVVSLVCSSCLWFVLTPKVFQLCTNHPVLVLCRFVWISEACQFFLHYNNRGLFCDLNIITNNKERSFRKPAVANHNSSQTLKLLWYHNICTRIITSPLQLPNLIQLQKISDCNCFYTLFVINNASETICNKPSS
jgi:hypothetical protein